MLTLTSSQKIWLLAYFILFNFLFSLVLYKTDNRPIKKPLEYLMYLIGFALFIIIFFSGAYLVLHYATHFSMASLFLVTKRFSEQQRKYMRFHTKEITAEETELLQTHIDNSKPVEGFYEYELVQDEKCIRSFYCMNSDLLDYVKVKDAQKKFKESQKSKS